MRIKYEHDGEVKIFKSVPEAVESSVAHSEVTTTPVTETQPSNTTPSVVEEKASSTVV